MYETIPCREAPKQQRVGKPLLNAEKRRRLGNQTMGLENMCQVLHANSTRQMKRRTCSRLLGRFAGKTMRCQSRSAGSYLVRFDSFVRLEAQVRRWVWSKVDGVIRGMDVCLETIHSKHHPNVCAENIFDECYEHSLQNKGAHAHTSMVPGPTTSQVPTAACSSILRIIHRRESCARCLNELHAGAVSTAELFGKTPLKVNPKTPRDSMFIFSM